MWTAAAESPPPAGYLTAEGVGQRGFLCGTAADTHAGDVWANRPKPLDPKRGAMTSTRRRLLRAVGVTTAAGGALAGCTSLTLRHPDATPTTDPPDGFWRWVSVEAVDGPPAEHAVGWDVTVAQPWITAERSARVAFTLTNEAHGARHVGPTIDGGVDAQGGGIRLYDVTDDADETFGAWCIDNDGKRDGRAGEGTNERGPVRLGPGESVTRTAVVLDDRKQRGCLPSGVYGFRVGQVVPYAGEREGEQEYYEVACSLGVQGEG
jgi:hypothetical protein